METNFQTNTQAVNQAKQDPKIILKKIIFPFGIVVASLGVLWMILHIALGLTYMPNEIVKFNEGLFKADKYIAMIILFLGIGMAGLMIPLSIRILSKMNNLKEELIPGVMNALVGLLFLTFSILSLTKVFDDETWFTESFRLNQVSIGIILGLSLYSFVYAKVNKTYVKVVILSAFILSFAAILPVLFAVVGFSIGGNAESARKLRAAGAFTHRLAITFIGTIAIGLLIPMTIAIIKKDEIIKFSVIAGIAFVFFLTIAIMGSMPKTTTGFYYEHSEIYAAFMVISWLAQLVPSILARAWTKKENENAPDKTEIKISNQ